MSLSSAGSRPSGLEVQGSLGEARLAFLNAIRYCKGSSRNSSHRPSPSGLPRRRPVEPRPETSNETISRRAHIGVVGGDVAPAGSQKQPEPIATAAMPPSISTMRSRPLAGRRGAEHGAATHAAAAGGAATAGSSSIIFGSSGSLVRSSMMALSQEALAAGCGHKRPSAVRFDFIWRNAAPAAAAFSG